MQEPMSTAQTMSVVLTGSLFLVLTLPLKSYLRRLAIKRIKENLKENEVIEYNPKFSYMIDYVLPWLFGGFTGYLLPLWTNPALMKMDPLTTIFFAVLEIGGFLAVFSLYCKNTVLTNTRILSLYGFSMLDKIGRVWNISYSDIESIHLNKNFIYTEFYLKIKQGKLFYLDDTLSNTQEIKNKIKDLSNKNNTLEGRNNNE